MGTISDDYGPVIGASVMIKGSTNGTITDFDGNFSLANCNSGDTLQVSYIGYITYQYCVSSSNYSNIKITLCEDTEDASTSCAGAACSSGGGCTVLACTACETAATEWVSTGTDGYETRLGGGTCSGNSCTSHGVCSNQVRQYRCADGYTGTTTDGKTGCKRLTTCSSGCCGTVIMESDGLPLIGATVVLIKSTTPSNGIAAGQISDINGSYNFPSCKVGDTLVFTFVALARQEIVITSSNRSGAIVVMPDDIGDGACDSGYYMDWSTGYSVCKQCPSDGDLSGYIPANNDGDYNNTIYYCRIPSGSAGSDETGSYEYTADCYYSN